MATRLGSVYFERCLHSFRDVSWKWQVCIRCNQWIPTPAGRKALDAQPRRPKRERTSYGNTK